jgi:hypothetical protein
LAQYSRPHLPQLAHAPPRAESPARSAIQERFFKSLALEAVSKAVV